MELATLVLDVMLLFGLTARLTRLVVADDLGLWFLRGPAVRWASAREPRADGWRAKLVSGLSCPYCVSVHVAFWAVLSLVVAYAVDGWLLGLWRFVAGFLSLSWLVAHVGVRLGDAGYDDDDEGTSRVS